MKTAIQSPPAISLLLRLAALAVFTLTVVGCAADQGDVAQTDASPAATEPAQSEPESAPEQDDSMFNTLRWQTASEVDNFGFDVFRGDSEEGPFTKVNEDPIAGAGTVDEPQKYVFVDRTNDPTRDYYYYVESISMSNVREHFTPVLKAKAKQPAAGTDE